MFRPRPLLFKSTSHFSGHRHGDAILSHAGVLWAFVMAEASRQACTAIIA
jgi:hypothetical protein